MCQLKIWKQGNHLVVGFIFNTYIGISFYGNPARKLLKEQRFLKVSSIQTITRIQPTAGSLMVLSVVRVDVGGSHTNNTEHTEQWGSRHLDDTKTCYVTAQAWRCWCFCKPKIMGLNPSHTLKAGRNCQMNELQKYKDRTGSNCFFDFLFIYRRRLKTVRLDRIFLSTPPAAAACSRTLKGMRLKVWVHD